MGHGSVFIWVTGSWVTACDQLPALVRSNRVELVKNGFTTHNARQNVNLKVADVEMLSCCSGTYS